MEKSEFLHLLDLYLSGKASADQEKMIINYYNSFDQIEWDTKLMGDIEEKERIVYMKIRETIHQSYAPVMPQQKIPFFKRNWPRYAAAVILIVSTALAYLLHTSKNSSPFVQTVNPIPVQPIQNNIAPGRNKAMLTLSNGKRIELTDGNETLNDGNVEIKKANGELVYESVENEEERLKRGTSFNTVSTPRGGQYKLNLPDGSAVWLNAASSITYPTAFTGKERKVYVTGEAYFEVTQNKLMPFRVIINDQEEVEVLGTHFNVNSYNRDEPSKTTLLEGSVKVTHDDKTVFIKPGQQSSFTKKGFVVTEPDIDKVMAWKTGFFDFDNIGLDAIMQQISRWYDVDIVYEGPLKATTFGGRISRNLYLLDILKRFEDNGITFRLEGKTLFIKP